MHLPVQGQEAKARPPRLLCQSSKCRRGRERLTGEAGLQGGALMSMRRRLARVRSEEGFTLLELLVASAMGVVVMSAVAMLMISAVRDQPKISKQAQNITTARWVLERMTREIRGGISITPGHV